MWSALNRGNTTHEAFLRNARNSEETLRREAIERTELSVVKEAALLAALESAEGEVYQVPSTGAMVSLNSAVGLIHFYCSQLPTDRYCSPCNHLRHRMLTILRH
jgi:endoribonuclease Dicer